MNQFPPRPRVSQLGPFRIFSKISGDIAAQGAPPVLLTLVAKFAVGVVDTDGKFDAGVVDTGGNLATSVLTPVANLPPVSLIPVVHLDLRMSQQIFEKI